MAISPNTHHIPIGTHLIVTEGCVSNNTGEHWIIEGSITITGKDDAPTTASHVSSVSSITLNDSPKASGRGMPGRQVTAAPTSRGKATFNFFGPNSRGGTVVSTGKITLGSTGSSRCMTTQELKDEVLRFIGEKDEEGFSASCVEYEGGEFAIEKRIVTIIKYPPKIILTDGSP